jgi:rare lipoprotein A
VHQFYLKWLKVVNYFLKFIFIISLSLIAISCSRSSRFSNEKEINERYARERALKVETGEASFYANEFDGKTTASGEIYDMNKLTAAHPSFPFNTVVNVINLSNDKSVQVRINDRMPNFKGRIIDLSLAAARKIGMVNTGIQEVKVEVIKWGSR